jgi:predicted aldo/keto reductase-like oxidoreductase
MSNRTLNRRTFIKKGSLGVISAAAGVKGLMMPSTAGKARSKIITRKLGKTNLKVPIISFGVMNSDKAGLIKKSIEKGILHLDTAHRYLRGNSEKVIGSVLKEMNCRKRIYVATKIALAQDREKNVFVSQGNTHVPGATPENFENQLNLSLERLQTDYVDILYLHSLYSKEMATYEPLLKALQKAKKDGKARFIGVTTHANEPEVIKAAVDTGIIEVIEVAYNYLQKNREEVKAAIKYAADWGVGIIGMKTFGGNSLQQDKTIKINHAAALKWVLNDPNVTTVIPGMTSFEQLEFNFKIMQDLKITPEEEKALAQAASLSGLLYCQNCRLCTSTCKSRVDIPQLMRAFMYSYGYNNSFQTADTIRSIPATKGLQVCTDCQKCTAQCAHGIDIPSRIRLLSTLAV